MKHEYRVIPAPTRGTKAKTAKTAEDRFALTLQDTMNEMARDGWEFLRAETLPSEERTGLTGRKTVYHNMLVFRREDRAALAAFQPRVLDTQTDGTGDAVPARPALSAVSAPAGKTPPLLSPLAGMLSRGGSDSNKD
jgi:hypothetical protein